MNSREVSSAFLGADNLIREVLTWLGVDPNRVVMVGYFVKPCSP